MTTTIRIHLIYLLALAVMVACGASTTDPTNTPDPNPAITGVHHLALGDTAVLELGESVVFQATGIRVQFLRVVADSRCPVGATCVWEGDAEVAVHVITGGQANEARLHTRLEPTEVGIASYTLRLVDLLPYPVADPTMDAPAPQLWLRLVPAGAN